MRKKYQYSGRAIMAGSAHLLSRQSLDSKGGLMKKHGLLVVITLLVLSGCHTTASFILPPNTDLMINGERVTFQSKDDEGRPQLETRPFFWTSVMGIEYSLVQNDKIIKTDRLPSSFRIVSVFWPPYALIYWPMGFRFDCYDLSDPKKEFIEKCPVHEKKNTTDKTQTSMTTH
jgi:hypothetical protein